MLLAMSRFGREVQGVTARLGESSSPLGGVDRRCRVRARLHSGLVLRAEAIDGEIDMAVGRSAARLARLVAASLDDRAGRQWPVPALRHRRFVE
jgi:hypothetical protein